MKNQSLTSKKTAKTKSSNLTTSELPATNATTANTSANSSSSFMPSTDSSSEIELDAHETPDEDIVEMKKSKKRTLDSIDSSSNYNSNSSKNENENENDLISNSLNKDEKDKVVPLTKKLKSNLKKTFYKDEDEEDEEDDEDDEDEDNEDEEEDDDDNITEIVSSDDEENVEEIPPETEEMLAKAEADRIAASIKGVTVVGGRTLRDRTKIANPQQDRYGEKERELLYIKDEKKELIRELKIWKETPELYEKSNEMNLNWPNLTLKMSLESVRSEHDRVRIALGLEATDEEFETEDEDYEDDEDEEEEEEEDEEDEDEDEDEDEEDEDDEEEEEDENEN